MRLDIGKQYRGAVKYRDNFSGRLDTFLSFEDLKDNSAFVLEGAGGKSGRITRIDLNNGEEIREISFYHDSLIKGSSCVFEDAKGLFSSLDSKDVPFSVDNEWRRVD